MSDLGSTVLSAIFPSNREALTTARERLTKEHFPDPIERTFFGLVESYAERYNDVISGKFLKDMLERSGMDAAKIVMYTEMYDRYATASVSEAEFKYSVDGLVEDVARQKTGEAIATAMEILERGAEVDDVKVEGYRAALEYLGRVQSEIDDGIDETDAPEGDVREEYERFLELYNERAAKVSSTGILSGVSAIDEVSGGIQNGEMVLLAGFTNHGKTQMTVQWAWEASVKQGKNVYFATSETVRDQVWRRFIARHSREPQFGLAGGLNVKDLKEATLSSDEYAVLQDVLQDLRNPDYGKFHIAQIPRNGTLTFMENRIIRAQKLWNVDYAICDYLANLHPEVKRANEREEFNDILRKVKTFITSFDKGRGLPFLSPWQMSRDARDKAVSSGGYQMSSLSDTSEAEKQSDLIVSLLRPDDQVPNEGILQILKARDSETMRPVPVYLDYRNSYIGEAPSAAPSSHSGGGFQFEPVGLL